jgi:hypothetical protein
LQARAELAVRLRARRGEIEEVALTRTHAIADSTDADPLYREGLGSAVAIALDYALETIERGEGRALPPPPALLAQARMAARSGIGLDTVLRRYQAGYGLLGDFLIEEVERSGLYGADALRGLLRNQAAVFDRLLAAIGEEYVRESQSRPSSPDRRRAELVQRLLDGELTGSPELTYELSTHHLGLIASGRDVAAMLRGIAASLDRRLLLVDRDDTSAWAWLGGRVPLDPEELQRLGEPMCSEGGTLAVGEPAEGLPGWRLTHRQAAAALPVALRGGTPFIRYADVAVLASVLGDHLLESSLHRLYLAPLEESRDGGASLRETLRAYFAADRNVSSAAAALGASRNTVTARLVLIEQKLGRPLASCIVDLEVALRLEKLDQASNPRSTERSLQDPPAF